jgi:hypothetical protein
MPMNFARTTPSVEASLGLKGLVQLRVLRAMLRLGAFTRKELATHSGEDLTAVNAIVGRHKDWFQEKGLVSTGSPGPRERRLVLRPEQQAELARVLDSMYDSAEQDAPRPSEPAHAYVPTAMEFQVASDLVSSLSEEGKATAGEVRRGLRLLEIASDKEGLPCSRDIKDYLTQDLSSASGTQRMARAYMDGIRSKLCFLSVPEFLGYDPGDAFGCHNPIKFGLAFLESAGLTFTALGAGKQVRELDLWAERHASPVMLRLLTNPEIGRKDWREQLLSAVRSSDFAKLVPRFVEPLGPRRFEMIDPTRVARAKSRVVCTIVEVNPFGSRPEVRYATQKRIRQASPGAIPVMVDGPKLLDGLISIYSANYHPQENHVAALVNVRHSEVQVAILKGTSLVVSKTIAPPPRRSSMFGPTMISSGRLPMFAAGGKHAVHEKDFLMVELKKIMEFYRQSPGAEKISAVYVTGEPRLRESIENALRSNLGMSIHALDAAKSMNLEVAGFSKTKNLARAQRLAPEIGIALKECWTLNRKKLLEQELASDTGGAARLLFLK